MTTSVIITAYNLEQYIADAIRSVLGQTQRPDEVIVVDDCSTDRTAEVIHSFGSQVRYLKLPQNSGGLTATFYGVQHATGEILLFLDGDDTWMPEKIASVLPLFEQYPTMAVVSHDYMRVDSDRNPLDIFDDTQANIARILATCKTVEEQSEAYKASILGKKGYWGGSAYSLRRSYVDTALFEQWRSGFPYIRNTYLDLVLPTFVIVHHPEVMVGYVDKKLFEYRIHAHQTSGNKIPTVEAAKKALRMGHCTTMGTYGLLKSHPRYARYARDQELHILEYEYLTDVYDNRKLPAFRKFVKLARRHWNKRQLVKESQRFGVSFLLGPKTFLKLKKRLS
jgi:glycosyltransferase involved in cell wall biosynthesis